MSSLSTHIQQTKELNNKNYKIMNKVNLISEKKQPTIEEGSLFKDPTTYRIYILTRRYGYYYCVSLVDGNMWKEAHKYKKEAVEGLTYLGECEITVKQL